MKKIFLLLVLAAIGAVLSGAGCSGGGDDSADDDNDTGADDDNGGGGLGTDDDVADDAADDVADDDTNWGHDDDSHWVDDDAADDVADDDGTTIFDIDFEDYTLGALGSPWTIFSRSGTSAAAIEQGIDSKDLILSGGITATDYYVARYGFTLTSKSMWVEFDAKLNAADSAFGFRIYQVFIGIPYTEVQLSVDGGFLQAENFTTTSYVDCVAMAPGEWHTIGVYLDYDAGLFNVLFDGDATSCQNMAQGLGDKTPYGKIEFIDWSDVNFGGIVYFDNFRGWY